MKKVNHILAIDMGGTNTDYALVCSDGKIVVRGSISTKGYPNFQTFMDALINSINEMIASAGVEGLSTVNDLKGIGIGAPNADHLRGCMVEPPNLKQFKGVSNFIDEFSRCGVTIPVVVDNDANAAALGEMVFGGAQGLKHFILITLGTGVGSGIVVDGQLVYGSTGNAGELGHLTLYPGGRKCSCGRRGCLEEYCSARGIEQTFRFLCGKKGVDIDSITREYARMSGDESGDGHIHCHHIGIAASDYKDPLALETFKRVGEDLGLALSSVVCFSAPEAIFLMGGPTKVGDPLLKPLIESFNNHILFLYKGKCRIEMSHLDSNNAALLGAAALVEARC